MACAQLQMERNRTRQLDRAAKAPPVASRRAEDELRRAFFAEVGGVLAALGAAPALRAPKKLQGDAGVCLRLAIGFLAARVSGRQRRRRSAPEAAPVPASLPASTGPTPSANTSGNTLGVGNSSGRDTSSVSNNNNNDNSNNNNESITTNTDDTGGSNHNNGESIADAGGGIDRSTGRFDGGVSSSPSLATSGGGGPSPIPLRTAGLSTAHTPRLSRRRRSLPAGAGAGGAGNSAFEITPPFAVAGTAEAAAAPTEDISSLLSEQTASQSAAGVGWPESVSASSPIETARALSPREEGAPLPPDGGGGGSGDGGRDEERRRNGSALLGRKKERAGAAAGTTPPRNSGGGGSGGSGSGAAAGVSCSRAAARQGAPPPPPPSQRCEPDTNTERHAPVDKKHSKAAMAGAGEEERLNSSRRAAPRSGAGRARLRPPGSSREEERAALGTDSGIGGGGNGGSVLGLDGEHAGGLRDYAAVGLEMSIVGGGGGSAAFKSSSSSSSGVVAGGQRRERKSFRQEDSSATAVDVEAVMAENVRLRQRVEELREIVDGEPPQPSAAGARGREGRGGGGGRAGSAAAAERAAAAAAAGPGPEAAACDAILRGQVAQLRRQIRLQWSRRCWATLKTPSSSWSRWEKVALRVVVPDPLAAFLPAKAVETRRVPPPAAVAEGPGSVFIPGWRWEGSSEMRRGLLGGRFSTA
ncbi:unnamed protein product [Ectocarpus fasciculatus]